jgi:hypothetical protein
MKQKQEVNYLAQCDDIQFSCTYEMYPKDGDWENFFPDGYGDTLIDGESLVTVSLARGGSITFTLAEIQSLCKHINKFADDRTDKAVDFAIEALQEIFPETEDDIFENNPTTMGEK